MSNIRKGSKVICIRDLSYPELGFYPKKGRVYKVKRKTRTIIVLLNGGYYEIKHFVKYNKLLKTLYE